MKKNIYLLIAAFIPCMDLSAQTVQNVNPLLFLEDGTNVIISTVACTLSNGASTTCYKITSTGMPTDHAMGPWCPNTISDDASAGGIWLEDGEVYDVDGEFIKNMATFYNDNNWLMYDSLGNIYTTETLADCAAAANPNVGEEYENFCVECDDSKETKGSQKHRKKGLVRLKTRLKPCKNRIPKEFNPEKSNTYRGKH